jgi:hypothetical protein
LERKAVLSANPVPPGGSFVVSFEPIQKEATAFLQLFPEVPSKAFISLDPFVCFLLGHGKRVQEFGPSFCLRVGSEVLEVEG